MRRFLRDHPRLRGEQSHSARDRVCKMGSPPLARGTVFTASSAPKNVRITPACAGNSYPLFCVLKRHGDHPRLRGEQSGMPTGIFHFVGSPPLARGTDPCFRNRLRGRGITPACAGNRRYPCRANWLTRDHPRLRGEQRYSSFLAPFSLGSPPLARGTAFGSSGSGIQ